MATIEPTLDVPRVCTDVSFADAVQSAQDANADRFVVEDTSGARFMVGEAALVHWAALRHPGDSPKQLDELRSLFHSPEPVLDALRSIGFPLQPLEDDDPSREGFGAGLRAPGIQRAAFSYVWQCESGQHQVSGTGGAPADPCPTGKAWRRVKI